MTIIDSLQDPAWFGRWFEGASWDRWRVFLKALHGHPLTPVECEVYRAHTGRTTPPTTPAREGWVIVGRRGGKSRIAALAAVWQATSKNWARVLAPGEVATLPVIAADRRQSRVVMRYIKAFFDTPLLRQLVKGETKESIELDNRVVIEVHTASFRAIRGYTLIGVVADEIAFWSTDETAADPDREILNGLRPGLATTGGLLLCISSPYAKRGELWRNYREHYGKDGDAVLVWQAATAAMNPNVDAQVIADAYADDESSASAEYGALFRSDLEAFVSRQTLDACVVPGRGELPPLAGTRYKAFTDPSGGSQDGFSLAIAHREDKHVVIDLVRERKPPFNPSEVVAEFAEVLKAYNCARVQGDRYAGEWPRERFREHRITYEPSEQPKSDLYGAFLPMLNSAQVELPDHAKLLGQLQRLERRTSRGGRDVIDHAPGSHDDLANAVAGAAVAVGIGARTRAMCRSYGGVQLAVGGWD